MGFGRRLAAVSGATAIYVGAATTAYSFVKPTSDAGPDCAVSFDGLSDRYDGLVNREETFMGVKLMRWWLVRQAKGDVLEVSAGTGRNLKYYDLESISSLTVTDVSKQMLWHAAEKYKNMHSDGSTPVHFKVADAVDICAASSASDLPTFAHPARSPKNSAPDDSDSRRRPASTAVPDDDGRGDISADKSRAQGAHTDAASSSEIHQGSYDTVIDTFGLCSHANPVEALQEVARACKPGGKIMLLEHGRSSYEWLNRILDNGAGQHKKRWACNWNLDIADVVEQSGLNIESMSRWHFGTTFVIVATPCRV